jgi:hypothetical protein
VVESAEERGRACAVETPVVVENANLQEKSAPETADVGAGRESLRLPGSHEVSSAGTGFASGSAGAVLTGLRPGDLGEHGVSSGSGGD